ncbi:MAG TPA: histidine--tRNA ligase [Eubacteriales bacterium]|nr:histidine--tRNA ligase [Eubacteriales bacterium]
MINKTPPKGMRDFLPSELALRNQTMAKIKEAYASCGFNEIETPCVDDINLLMSKQSGENEKLMYKILKRGEKLEKASDGELCDLGLRYELTLSLARYCANNAGVIPPVFKSIQVGPVFRADRPQKGRYRQFIQCDIDIIGEESILAEIDLIIATAKALKNVGLSGFTIKINDRRILKRLAAVCGFSESDYEKVFISLDKLDKIGIDGVKNELLKEFPAEKVEKLLSIADKITSADSPLDECGKLLGGIENEINELKQIIFAVSKCSEAKLVYDITLVRGLSYYTGAIFEINADGIPYALGGGGRYNELLGKITGTNVPACGFSIGFERIVDLLAEQKIVAKRKKCVALIVPKEYADQAEGIFTAAEKIRESGENCGVYKKMKNFAYQLKVLTDIGCDEFYLYENGDTKKI